MEGVAEVSSRPDARRAIYNATYMFLKLPFFNFAPHRDVVSLAASSTYTNLYHGNICGLFVAVRPATLTAANQGTYSALASLDVHLSSGESITGHETKLHEDWKLDCSELVFRVLWGYKTESLFLHFGSKPYPPFGDVRASCGNIHSRALDLECYIKDAGVFGYVR